MTFFFKHERIAFIALITLSVVPIIGGFARLSQLSLGILTPENARYIAVPVPVVVHIVSATFFSLIGAMLFLPSLRRKNPGRHRFLGKISVGSGLLTAISGLWMTVIYPTVNHDGFIVFVMRILVGSAMVAFISAGILAIQQRNFRRHGEWMGRVYALALGAGTQVLTHIPQMVFPSIQGETARAFSMGLGWGINILIAEWIIRTREEQFTRDSHSDLKQV